MNRVLSGLGIVLLLMGSLAHAGWPQFMGGQQLCGVSDSSLDPENLALRSRVPLGDCILTSPVVSGGVAYVVDQMGDAYAVDTSDGSIRWTFDRGDTLTGGNTSTPAIADGRLVYGTTSGKLIFLDQLSGALLHQVDLHWPVVSSVTAANGCFYVSTVDSCVHKFSSSGEHVWTWDHYQLSHRWREFDSPDSAQAALHEDRFSLPHFGGMPVAIYQDLLFAPIGYALVCLKDLGDEVEKVWQIEKPVTQYDVPVGASTDGRFVYAAWPKSDGEGFVIKHRMEDGAVVGVARDQWAVLDPPSVHHGGIVFNRHAFGAAEIRIEETGIDEQWRAYGITAKENVAAIGAVALTGDHAAVTTLAGELLLFARTNQEQGTAPITPVFRFAIQGSDAVISSSPAISDGMIFFGADDGCLYIIGNPGSGEEANSSLADASKPNHTHSVSPPKQGGIIEPQDDASQKRLLSAASPQWPSAFGGEQNQSFVADPDIRPPFRLRWAMKGYGLFKHSLCAAQGDLLYSDMSALVVCRDATSGRIRWRRKVAGQAWSRATPLCADGKFFVPRLSSPRYAKIVDQPDSLLCFDQASGKLLWERRIGRGDWLRASPVYVDGVVAYGSKYETPRDSKTLIGPEHRWLVAQEPVDDSWWKESLDPARCVESVISNDGRLAEHLYHAAPAKLCLQTRCDVPDFDSQEETLAVMHGPSDQWMLAIDGEIVCQSDDWGSELNHPGTKYVGVAASMTRIQVPILPGERTISLALRRTKVKSNVSGSSSICPPRLIMTPKTAVQGPVIDAFHAQTGERMWSYSLPASGDYIEGPAGCSDGKRFYFTGGGSGPQGSGQTIALDPTSGQVLWATESAFACRTGTPTITVDRILLPGALHQPLAAIKRDSGELIWQNDSVTELTHVHAASVWEDRFTVNTKYVGGAKCWDVGSGQPCIPDQPTNAGPLDLASQGHTCGTIVLLQSGYAVAATNKGIYCTDVNSGEIVSLTPGFASQTCPHPIFAAGRMYYAPQNTGMLFCFD